MLRELELEERNLRLAVEREQMFIADLERRVNDKLDEIRQINPLWRDTREEQGKYCSPAPVPDS